MDATAYYAKNAKIHNTESDDLSPVLSSGFPPDPSEVDWAVYWLRRFKKSGSCLDVGCAQLALLRSLEGQFEHRFGLDIASCNNWSSHPNIQTQVRDLDKGPLPFDDHSFDAVTMLMVLEHVFDPFHATRELRRVCKPDGLVIVAVPNLASLRNRLSLLRGRLPVTSASFTFNEDSWDGYHLHNFTQASLEWLLRRAGLKPVRWASAGSFQVLKRKRPAFFGGDLIALCRVVVPELNRPAKF